MLYSSSIPSVIPPALTPVTTRISAAPWISTAARALWIAPWILAPNEFQGAATGEFIAWLQQNGLAVDGSADFLDGDGDGMNNWQEWRCGTDPVNASSVAQDGRTREQPFRHDAPVAKRARHRLLYPAQQQSFFLTSICFDSKQSRRSGGHHQLSGHERHWSRPLFLPDRGSVALCALLQPE